MTEPPPDAGSGNCFRAESYFAALAATGVTM